MYTTIEHIETLERSLIYNENLLANVTTRIQQRMSKLIRQEEVTNTSW